jgi:hypothetical protein
MPDAVGIAQKALSRIYRGWPATAAAAKNLVAVGDSNAGAYGIGGIIGIYRGGGLPE